jgi:hypothetical protein
VEGQETVAEQHIATCARRNPCQALIPQGSHLKIKKMMKII